MTSSDERTDGRGAGWMRRANYLAIGCLLLVSVWPAFTDGARWRFVALRRAGVIDNDNLSRIPSHLCDARIPLDAWLVEPVDRAVNTLSAMLLVTAGFNLMMLSALRATTLETETSGQEHHSPDMWPIAGGVLAFAFGIAMAVIAWSMTQAVQATAWQITLYFLAIAVGGVLLGLLGLRTLHVGYLACWLGQTVAVLLLPCRTGGMEILFTAIPTALGAMPIIAGLTFGRMARALINRKVRSLPSLGKAASTGPSRRIRLMLLAWNGLALAGFLMAEIDVARYVSNRVPERIAILRDFGVLREDRLRQYDAHVADRLGKKGGAWIADVEFGTAVAIPLAGLACSAAHLLLFLLPVRDSGAGA